MLLVEHLITSYKETTFWSLSVLVSCLFFCARLMSRLEVIKLINGGGCNRMFRVS